LNTKVFFSSGLIYLGIVLSTNFVGGFLLRPVVNSYQLSIA